MKRRTMGTIIAVALITVLAAVATGCGGTTTTTAEGATTTAGASTTITASGVDGAAVFAGTCAGCHGADGTGNTGPDLTAKTGIAKDRIVDQVTNGGTKMPEYGSKLTADEISAVADYVLSDIVK